MGRSYSIRTVVIQASASLSDEVALDGRTLVKIQLPTAWTGSGVLTFNETIDDETYCPVLDSDGVEVQVAGCAASKILVLNPVDWIIAKTIKIRSGTTASPVVQASARTLYLFLIE
jgi:hypothetical protein